MDERPDDTTDEPRTDPIGTGADDVLARRIRTAVDGSVAPVALDEVLALAGDGAASGPDRATGGPADAADAVPITTVVSARRRRTPLVLAAAAVVIVVLGLGLAVARNRSDSVIAGPGETSGASVPPAPGGIYDPASDALRDKRVEAVAAGDDLVFLGYVGGDPDPLTEDDPSIPPSVRYGLLVVDAADGAVLADHALAGRPSEWAMATVGDRVWFATEGERATVEADPPADLGAGGDPPTEPMVLGPSTVASTLWVADGTGTPQLVDEYDGGVSLAATDDAVWVRSFQRLDRRDVETGAVVDRSPDDVWRADGVVAADGDVVWATDEGEVARVVGMGPSVPVAVQKDDFAARRLYVAGDDALVVDGTSAARIVGGSVAEYHGVGEAAGLLGADARQGRFWLAALDEDPGTALIGLLTIEAGSGDLHGAQVSLLGERPLIAALADGDAVVCVAAVRTADTDEPTPAGFGSDCRRVARPTDAVGPTKPPAPGGTARTTSTVPVPSVDDGRVGETILPTTTAAPTTTMTPVTTRPPARPLALNGIGLDGLAPIRLGMTPAEVAAATGLVMVEHEPLCAGGRWDIVGLPEGVLVTFQEGDTVKGMTIFNPAYSTIDGLRVGSSVTELVTLHPDVEVEGDSTYATYALIAPDRSSGIFFGANGDSITSIVVRLGDVGAMDLC